MNAHFSNACNSVAFTWGTQRTYHAAQFGDRDASSFSRFWGGHSEPFKPGDVGPEETQHLWTDPQEQRLQKLKFRRYRLRRNGQAVELANELSPPENEEVNTLETRRKRAGRENYPANYFRPRRGE